MLSFLKKNRIIIALFSLLIIVYFASRLVTILSLPIFTDEAIYVRWSQIGKQDPSWRFISLTDGKQPLFTWLTMFVMEFVNNPLLAGRLVSVGSGFFAMVGMFFLGKELFKNKIVGLVSSFFYVIFPFTLVYDRMALYDSVTGAFAVWSMYLCVLLFRYVRLDIALIYGMVAGASVLNKSNGFFNIYLLPFGLLLFNYSSKERIRRLFKLLFFSSIIIVFTYVCYSFLRLSPYFYLIDEKNTIFIYPFKEWIMHPVEFFVSNWKGMFNWFITYFTIPFLLLMLSAFVVDKKFLREKTFLFLWFFLPFLALAIFGKTIYPRYILSMVLALLPLGAYLAVVLFSKIKNKLIYWVLMAAIIAFPVVSDYFILFDFKNAKIPVSDISQYNNDWPSGGGVNEAVAFFEKESKKGKIFVATQGTFGLMPYSLEIFLHDNKNVTIKGYWPTEATIPDEVLAKSKKMPTYFVFYQPCINCEEKGIAPISWNVTKVLSVDKPSPRTHFTVYKVN